ncbi:toprim domain-containing protein [Piscinibacter sp. Jin2]|uniref:Toprim domain-containing protein n=1 Tax=Aquariibacter lacus TaxID=2801332 RepID=A0A9X1BNN6_9BURK|nr:toprim domain-containing protein [Piscinibacter lacus]
MIGIAEGIETAQAAHSASGLPTVAASCASSLAAYVWPPATRRIVVFANADVVGTAAAQTLKARAVRAGLDVKVLTPSTPGMDWCDVWAARTLTEVQALQQGFQDGHGRGSLPAGKGSGGEGRSQRPAAGGFSRASTRSTQTSSASLSVRRCSSGSRGGS